MSTRGRSISILMADDDAEDRHLAKKALAQARVANDLSVVEDGEELLEYLRREGRYATPGASTRPDLILLDLKMPKKDGREALREIRQDPDLRTIPVVVLTTSRAEEDIYRSYDLGANCYIAKPVTFEGLVKAMSTLGSFWFDIVQLPPPPPES